jgi:hypothetical protein
MGLNHSPRIVTDGLVLCLDAANPKSYPGSGTTWFDLSSSKYVFTTAAAPTFTTDALGNKCFEFSGAAKYFDSTTNSPFSGNQFAITVIAVVNQFSTGSFYGILTQHEQDSTNSMAFLSLAGRFGTDHWNPGGRQLTNLPNNNQIYHVSWVIPRWQDHQTTDTKIYLNGVDQLTESYSVDTVGSLVAKPFRIGNWQLNRTDMDFQGRIYAIKVYNKALSAAEIQQNFNALRGRFGI